MDYTIKISKMMISSVSTYITFTQYRIEWLQITIQPSDFANFIPTVEKMDKPLLRKVSFF
jgi:hypothetical protein